jgi:RHS repeat-associated protein
VTVKTYTPYGIKTTAGATGTTPIGFEGGYQDPGGLVYLINREYDPSSAQFLQVDPAIDLTQQPYSYANGDPVNGSDPLGLFDLGKFLEGLEFAWEALNTAGVGVMVIAATVFGEIPSAGVSTVGLLAAAGIFTGSLALGYASYNSFEAAFASNAKATGGSHRARKTSPGCGATHRDHVHKR